MLIDGHGLSPVASDRAPGTTSSGAATLVTFVTLAALAPAAAPTSDAATAIVPRMPSFCRLPIVRRASRVACLRATASAFASTLISGFFAGG